MNRRWATVVVGAALAILALGLVFAWRGRGRQTSPAAAEEVQAEPAAVATETWTATLWLPSESGLLAPESAALASAPDPRARTVAVLEALLTDQPGPPNAPVFPTPVALGHLLLVDGTAYVDLRPEGGGEPPASGSNLELLRVYAIVHTVVRNVREVRQVVLLWNGVERPGFAGHVDTGHPLRPRAELEGS